MKKKITIYVFILAFSTVVFGTAESPSAPMVVIWEPFYWQMGEGSGSQLVSACQYEDPLYQEFRYRDQDPNAGVEECTRYWADLMGWNSGVSLISTHGNDTYLVLAADPCYATLLDWADDEDDLYVSPRYANYGGYNLYTVSAKTSYCTNYWKNAYDLARAIIFLGACTSYPNFADTDVIGGVTVFGYPGYATFGNTQNNIVSIFYNMCGFYNNGIYREASDAYSLGVEANLQKDGGASTLAPAPVIEDPVSPLGAGAGASGIGYIEFDTKMDTSISATDALTWSLISGTASVSNIQWYNDYMITFSYSGTSGYLIQMTAVADKCRAPTTIAYPGYYLKLNGDRINGNGDDKVWTFSY
ncbi:MAG: hypothetical protein JW787_16215 [Sedimentisphaerales bacterium]|nr:hypothetical protein [Sedimentisphaerales bacterium]